MQWIVSHLTLILTCALIVSEAAATLCQLAFPSNKGVAGVMAGIIKMLQALGAKNPDSAV